MAETLRNLVDTLAVLPSQLNEEISGQDQRDAVASMFATTGSTGTSTVYQNVVVHGADPTGVADSSAAIQAAVDAAGDSGNPSVVFFPPGVYLIKTAITMTYDRQTWIMHGVKIRVWVGTSPLIGTAFTFGESGESHRHFRLEGHLDLLPTGGSAWNWTVGAIGVRLHHLNFSEFDMVSVSQLYKGLQILADGETGGSGINRIGIGSIHNCLNGVEWKTANRGSVTHVAIHGGRVSLGNDITYGGVGNDLDAALGHAWSMNSTAEEFTINDTTNATPVEVTVENSANNVIWHGLETGDTIVISGTNGTLNGPHTITVTGGTTFTLDGSSGDGGWASGGIVTPDEAARFLVSANSIYDTEFEGGENGATVPNVKGWTYPGFLNGKRCIFNNARHETGGVNLDKQITVKTFYEGEGSEFISPQTIFSGAPELTFDFHAPLKVFVRNFDGVLLPIDTIPAADPNVKGRLFRSGTDLKISEG